MRKRQRRMNAFNAGKEENTHGEEKKKGQRQRGSKFFYPICL
jgi:hypothetical protein